MRVEAKPPLLKTGRNASQSLLCCFLGLMEMLKRPRSGVKGSRRRKTSLPSISRLKGKAIQKLSEGTTAQGSSIDTSTLLTLTEKPKKPLRALQTCNIFLSNDDDVAPVRVLAVVKRRGRSEEVFRRPLNMNFSISGNRVIGSGMSGDVLLGTCRTSGKSVAIKRINLKCPGSNVSDSQQAKHSEFAMREVELHSSLSHPNIVSVVEVCTFQSVRESGQEMLALVTEYCRGGELYGYVVKKGFLHENMARNLMKQMFDAVSYLHNVVGIVHRDLKLENWVISNDVECVEAPSLRLLDFGLAIKPDRNRPMTDCLGTALYCAPEVASRLPYSSSVDLWSLGVTGFMLLTGRPCVWGKNDKEIISRLRRIWCSEMNADDKYKGKWQSYIEYKLYTRPSGAKGGNEWQEPSFECSELILRLLSVDPEHRPSVEEALGARWISA